MPPRLARQHTAVACEECRKRKLRCNREKPKCGTCTNAGVECITTTERLPRGPKKGSIKALRTRLDLLEEQLSQQRGAEEVVILDHDHDDAHTSSWNASNLPVQPLTTEPAHTAPVRPRCELSMDTASGTVARTDPSTSAPTDADANPRPNLHSLLTEAGMGLVPDLPSPSASERTPPRMCPLDDMTRTDLDQLYFERVHTALPILNKQRYFFKNKQNRYSACLQQAMWVVAMALSSQFEYLREPLYRETRKMLEECELDVDDTDIDQEGHTELTQAWILLTVYEFLRVNYRRGWMSAGRVFRLVQLMHLHQMDGIRASAPPLDHIDEISLEEKRRAFWAAYCLDRFIACPLKKLPLAINEDTICTRLPASEQEFQSGSFAPGLYLSEAMTLSDPAASGSLAGSQFANIILLATLYGRALSHANVSDMEQTLANGATTAVEEFWARHSKIDSAIAQRLRAMPYLSVSPIPLPAVPLSSLWLLSLSVSPPSWVPVASEPLAMMQSMILNATTIYLYNTMEHFTLDHTSMFRVLEYQKRAQAAAKEIARISKIISNLGFFTVYIFTPAAVFLAADRLARWSDADTYGLLIDGADKHDIASDLEACMGILRKICGVNTLAQRYLLMLDEGNTSGTLSRESI